MVKFKTDPDLGSVVSETKTFSFGAAPMTQFKEIVFAAGGHKFSQLCGFKFTSKAPGEHKTFFISFVCKLRSKIYHTAVSNPSKWFIFKKIANNEIHCLDKKTTLAQYGFDVDKFFSSDLFATTLPKFKATIEKGLKEYVPAYVKAHGAERAKDLLTSYDGLDKKATVSDAIGRYATAISECLPLLDDTYCNDKFYKLIDYDIKVESEENINEARRISIETLGELKKEIKKQQMANAANDMMLIVFEDDLGTKFNISGANVVHDEKINEDVLAFNLDVVANESEINEDDIVQEASDFECEVKKEEEDGKEVFKLYELKTHMWVATFHDEQAAESFSKEYPRLKQQYIKNAKQVEAEKQMVEKEVSEEEVAEKELDDKIEEAMKEIYK